VSRSFIRPWGHFHSAGWVSTLEALEVACECVDHPLMLGDNGISACWSKNECSRVRTHGQEDFGVIDINLSA
jgi:hypothetical protein